MLRAQQILFPPSLTARQRALLHEVAESNGAQHASAGEGAERRLRLGDAAAATVSTLFALLNHMYLSSCVVSEAKHQALGHEQPSTEQAYHCPASVRQTVAHLTLSAALPG